MAWPEVVKVFEQKAYGQGYLFLAGLAVVGVTAVAAVAAVGLARGGYVSGI